MKKTVLTFGLLSGAVSVAMMFATIPFVEQIGFDHMLVVGYTTIVISFLFVYFGMRSYRDNVLGGTMTFGKGFNAGILITLISCVCYVAAWLVIYYTVMPDFGERYGAYLLADLQAKGASQAEVDALVKSSADMSAMLANPLTNAALTFTEPFPVGLLITLISAAVLRKKAADA
jgi:hypothetical protein